MKYLVHGLLAAMSAGLCSPGYADALDDAYAAYMDAWDAAPLSVRKAVFVDDAALGYGLYVERESNAFDAGEPLVVYLEPVGYGYGSASSDDSIRIPTSVP